MTLVYVPAFRVEDPPHQISEEGISEVKSSRSSLDAKVHSSFPVNMGAQTERTLDLPRSLNKNVHRPS
jgi:hypothetical protein